MTIEQLEHIACVARTGSISRAAAELHMSQPALSRSIRRLEDELGCGLLRRTANRSALTEAGCIAADYADDLLRTYRRMRDELSSLETRRRTLRIGTCAPAPLWRVTQLVVETTPGTIVASESLDEQHLRRGLMEDTLDATITLNPLVLPGFISQSRANRRCAFATSTARPSSYTPTSASGAASSSASCRMRHSSGRRIARCLRFCSPRAMLSRLAPRRQRRIHRIRPKTLPASRSRSATPAPARRSILCIARTGRARALSSSSACYHGFSLSPSPRALVAPLARARRAPPPRPSCRQPSRQRDSGPRTRGRRCNPPHGHRARNSGRAQNRVPRCAGRRGRRTC